MKRVIFAVVILLGFRAGSFAGSDPVSFKDPAGINEQLLQTFRKTFPNAEEVQWQESTDKYTVNFRENGIVTRIEYDKEGNFTASARYYSESHLPVNILCKLRRKYPGKSVYGVTEITTDTEVEYYIKLEDGKNWITVRSSSEGSLEITENYRKTLSK